MVFGLRNLMPEVPLESTTGNYYKAILKKLKNLWMVSSSFSLKISGKKKFENSSFAKKNSF